MSAISQTLDSEFGDDGLISLGTDMNSDIIIDKKQNIYVHSMDRGPKSFKVSIRKMNAAGVWDKSFGEDGKFSYSIKHNNPPGYSFSRFELHNNHIVIYDKMKPKLGIQIIDLKANKMRKVKVKNKKEEFEVLTISKKKEIVYYQHPYIRAINRKGTESKSFGTQGVLNIFQDLDPEEHKLRHSKLTKNILEVLIIQTGHPKYYRSFINVRNEAKSTAPEFYEFEQTPARKVFDDFYVYTKELEKDKIPYYKFEDYINNGVPEFYRNQNGVPPGHSESAQIKYDDQILNIYQFPKDESSYKPNKNHLMGDYYYNLIMLDYKANKIKEFGKDGVWKWEKDGFLRKCFKLNDEEVILVIYKLKGKEIYKLKL